MKKHYFMCMFFIFIIFDISYSQQTELNISYTSSTETDTYKQERCKLDIRYFPDEKERPVAIFFHSGGLNTSEKYFPYYYRNLRYIEVAPNYRLSPTALCPAYIEDAAEAVAWVWNNIESYGGDKHKIIITGNSAGAYLAVMLALDSTYLAKFGIDSNDIWIYFIESAQMTTHFTVLKEQGINAGSNTKIVDQYAPLFHKRYISPYIVLVTGDRDLDMPGRYEQNMELYNALDSLNTKVLYWEFPGESHVTVGAVARSRLVTFLKNETFFEMFSDFSYIMPTKKDENEQYWNDSGTLYNIDGRKDKLSSYSNIRSGIPYILRTSHNKSLKFLKAF